jgi:hypothetical protein
MSFDPTKPANNSRILSPELRNQFNALKALIDAQGAQITALTLQVNGQQALITALQSAITSLNATVVALANIVPVGTMLHWCKNSFGVALVLPENFMECNGQVVNDPESPLNGETLPNPNGAGQFLRGAALSGDSGGSATHTHDIEVGSGFDGVNVDTGGSGQALQNNPTTTSAASSLPPYYEVVLVMRVK